MLCFAIDNIDSFNNIDEWHNEIKNQRQDIPVVLIATKKDMRQPEHTSSTVSEQDLRDKRLELGFQSCYQTTINDANSIKNAFVTAIKAGLIAKFEC